LNQGLQRSGEAIGGSERSLVGCRSVRAAQPGRRLERRVVALRIGMACGGVDARNACDRDGECCEQTASA
jgi:hypothetical protein